MVRAATLLLVSVKVTEGMGKFLGEGTGAEGVSSQDRALGGRGGDRGGDRGSDRKRDRGGGGCV